MGRAADGADHRSAILTRAPGPAEGGAVSKFLNHKYEIPSGEYDRGGTGPRTICRPHPCTERCESARLLARTPAVHWRYGTRRWREMDSNFRFRPILAPVSEASPCQSLLDRSRRQLSRRGLNLGRDIYGWTVAIDGTPAYQNSCASWASARRVCGLRICWRRIPLRRDRGRR